MEIKRVTLGSVHHFRDHPLIAYGECRVQVHSANSLEGNEVMLNKL